MTLIFVSPSLDNRRCMFPNIESISSLLRYIGLGDIERSNISPDYNGLGYIACSSTLPDYIVCRNIARCDI